MAKILPLFLHNQPALTLNCNNYNDRKALYGYNLELSGSKDLFRGSFIE